MEFKTQWNSIPDPGEKLSQVNITERVGYVSTEDRIKSLIRSGQQLQLYRASQFSYDFDVDIDDQEIDPTSSKSFDFAEAFAHLQLLNSKALTRKKKEVKNEKEVEKEVEKADPDPPMETVVPNS